MFRDFENLELVPSLLEGEGGANISVASSESAKGSMLMPPASANFNKTFSWNLEIRTGHFLGHPRNQKKKTFNKTEIHEIWQVSSLRSNHTSMMIDVSESLGVD